MTSRLAFSKRRTKCNHFSNKSRQHNSLGLKTIISKHVRPFSVFFFCWCFHNSYPQPYLQKYKPYIKCNQITRLVNLLKTLHLRCCSTGRLTRFDLKMCLSNHVFWKQDGFSTGSTINYQHRQGSGQRH